MCRYKFVEQSRIIFSSLERNGAVLDGGNDRNAQRGHSSGVQAGSATAIVPLYVNTGGNFNAPPNTSGTQIGSVTTTFSDCTNMSLAFVFTDGSNRSGTIPLTRLTPNVTCTPSSHVGTNAEFALSDNWYDPRRVGQGFVFEVNPVANLLFFAWYTYGVNAGPGLAGQRWYTGLSNLTPHAGSMPFTLYETVGGAFNASTPSPTSSQVGTGTLTFSSCSNAKVAFSYTRGSSAGQSDTIDLVRVGPVAHRTRVLVTSDIGMLEVASSVAHTSTPYVRYRCRADS